MNALSALRDALGGKGQEYRECDKAGLDAVAGVRSQAQRRDGWGYGGSTTWGCPPSQKHPTKTENDVGLGLKTVPWRSDLATPGVNRRLTFQVLHVEAAHCVDRFSLASACLWREDDVGVEWQRPGSASNRRKSGRSKQTAGREPRLGCDVLQLSPT